MLNLKTSTLNKIQNRLYLQRTKTTLNQNKQISDKAFSRLMKSDYNRSHAYGGVDDEFIGYPGAASVDDVVDYDAYQKFLEDYMNANSNRMGINPQGPLFNAPDVPPNYY